jgi:hypothetical protein
MCDAGDRCGSSDTRDLKEQENASRVRSHVLELGFVLGGVDAGFDDQGAGT